MTTSDEMEEIQELTEALREAVESVDWGDRDKHPVLRSGSTMKKIEAFVEKLGAPFPKQYAAFLCLANGMEGASGSEWLIRGTTDSRVGTKFKSMEREFLPTDDYTPRIAAIRNEHSPTAEDSFLIATNFENGFAVLRRNGDDFAPQVYQFLTPDLTSPVMVYDDFTAFLAFVLGTYEELMEDFYDEDFSLEEEMTQKTHSSSKSKDGCSMEELDSLLEQIESARQRYGDDLKIISESKGKKKKPNLSDDLDDFSYSPEPTHTRPQKTEEGADMDIAIEFVSTLIDNLIEEELLELVPKRNARSKLEDAMLKVLTDATSPKQATNELFELLENSKEIEELYGTDSEILGIINQAFADSKG